MAGEDSGSGDSAWGWLGAGRGKVGRVAGGLRVSGRALGAMSPRQCSGRWLSRCGGLGGGRGEWWRREEAGLGIAGLGLGGLVGHLGIGQLVWGGGDVALALVECSGMALLVCSRRDAGGQFVLLPFLDLLFPEFFSGIGERSGSLDWWRRRRRRSCCWKRIDLFGRGVPQAVKG